MVFDLRRPRDLPGNPDPREGMVRVLVNGSAGIENGPFTPPERHPSRSPAGSVGTRRRFLRRRRAG